MLLVSQNSIALNALMTKVQDVCVLQFQMAHRLQPLLRVARSLLWHKTKLVDRQHYHASQEHVMTNRLSSRAWGRSG